MLVRHYYTRNRGLERCLILFGYLTIASLSKPGKNCCKVNTFLGIIVNNHLVFLPIIRTKTIILIALSMLYMFNLYFKMVLNTEHCGYCKDSKNRYWRNITVFNDKLQRVLLKEKQEQERLNKQKPQCLRSYINFQ